MHLGHWLVRLGRAKQSQSTQQETKYVADTDIKYSFLMEHFIQITEGAVAYYSSRDTANLCKF